jgi:aminopeptidase N
MKRYIKCSIFLLIFIRVNLVFASNNAGNDTSWYSDYDVKWYKLDLHATDTVAYVWGNTTMLVRILQSFKDTFICDLGNNVEIDSIKIDGILHNNIRIGEILKIPLYKKRHQDELISVQIFHRGQKNESGFFSALKSKIDEAWNIPVTWTLSEPFGAKVWFPCKQSLSDKADSATIFITVPKRLKAGSNGLLQRVTSINNDFDRYEWFTRYPIAYYLISFCVSEYSEYSFYASIGHNDSVLVQNYIYNRPGFLEKNKEQIDATSGFITLFSELFGDYPFKHEKYGHCVAPMGGGMEHQTMTTLYNFGYDLISHELAHQWFGNLVTCSSWQDIWINEGFASYAEYLAIENLKTKSKAIEWMKKAHSYAKQYPDASIKVPADCEDENRIFNYYITYKKGAAIIHTLRDEINNDSVFFSILREFLSVYAYKSASVTDFITIVNQKTGCNYQWFFDQWFYGVGFPEVEVLWKNEKGLLTIDSRQLHQEKISNPFRFIYKIKVHSAHGDTSFRIHQDSWDQQFTFQLKEDSIKLEINPEYQVLMDVNELMKASGIPTMDDFFTVSNEQNRSNLLINFASPLTEKVLLQITDYNNNLLLERMIKKKQKTIIDIGLLEKGNYLLHIKTSKNKYIRKISKQ